MNRSHSKKVRSALTSDAAEHEWFRMTVRQPNVSYFCNG